ncbi:MAG TPA: hypothetical protein VIF62_13350 [Labilithrix sp.]|jgi:hypothetical protein
MRLSPFFLLLPLVLLASSRPASACACCSDPGERIESSRKLEKYEHDELDKIRFAKKSRLYLNAAGPNGVDGIDDPQDAYEVTLARAADRWTFTFTDAKGKTGTLAFTVPGAIDQFFVDTQESKAAGDPVLYKEWRLTAPATATGIFAKSGAPMIRLVLQGRGNACTDASQFASYALEGFGPKASFRFFGPLVK